MTIEVCTACVGDATAVPSKGKPGASSYEVDATAVSTGLKSELQAGEFALTLDAGRALGGEQSGPSPVQAFISSIVACTQVYYVVN